MKSIRFFLFLVVLVASLFLVGGCYRHYVDVYLNDQCHMVTMENNDVINPLIVFKGDYVIFNNISSAPVELNLPDGVFERDDVTIAVGKRVILKVIMNGPTESPMNIECTGGSGSPKVFVGEEP